MPTNLPSGFDAEMEAELEARLGSAWADELMRKWGYEWAAGCEEAMAEELGAGWASESAEDKAEALYGLVAAPVPTPEEDDEAEHDGPPAEIKEVLPGDPPALDDLPWVNSFSFAAKFEDWLVYQAEVNLDLIPPSVLGEASRAAEEAAREAEEAA